MSLAAELLGHWAPILSAVELQTARHGRFEVYCDGELVFSKAELKRFPKDGELSKLLEPRLGAPLAWR